MIDKLNHAGDRIVWENPMEMLDDIWLARKQRDTWREIANGLSLAINTTTVVATSPEHVRVAMERFNNQVITEEEGK